MINDAVEFSEKLGCGETLPSRVGPKEGAGRCKLG